MSLSVGTMGVIDLAEWLAAHAEYATVVDGTAALDLAYVDTVGMVGTAVETAGGPALTVIGGAGQSALDVAAAAGEALEATTATANTAAVGLVQGQSSFSAAAVLGMDLGVAAAAAAPILGVALGVGLYQDNPELWTKISEKLLPFCYPGTTKIPTWAEIIDDAWNASLPKKVIDALKEALIEEGFNPADVTVTPSQSTLSYYGRSSAGNPASGVSWSSNTGDGSIILSAGIVYTIYQSSRAYWCAVSTTPFTWTNTKTGRSGSSTPYTSNWSRVQYYVTDWTEFSTNVEGEHINSVSPAYSTNGWWRPTTMGEVADITFYNSDIETGYYPEGTSKWEGNVPSEIPQSKPAVIGIDATTSQPITQPMVPISPPYPIIVIPDPIEVEPEPSIIPFPWPEPTTPGHTEPWPETMPWPLPSEQPSWWPQELPYPYQYPVPQPTIDPEVNPDPDIIIDPDEQIEPYILPLPRPYEVPVPLQPTVTDPKLDPTTPRPPVNTSPSDPPIGSTFDPVPSGVSPYPSMPTTPLSFSQGVGLVTVYHPTTAQLYSFEQWLWVTYADATIDKIFNNPFDGVITLFELYCTPTDVGTQNIKSGFLDSGINSAVISRYTEIDCGTLGIPEYYGNYFDYSPYSKAHCYLPFIGIVELNVDDIVGHAVNITYRIDEYNGSCIAMITVAKVTEVNGEDVEYSNTMYQFSGNCSVELPLAGGSQASIKAGMMQADAYQNAGQISAVTGIIGGLASLLLGNIGGTISGVGGGIAANAYANANYLSNMLSGKSVVQKSGSFSASHGALGIKKPFITITRPKQIQVANYNELYGYPAHKIVYVGACNGFLRCREVHVISATATDEEKTMIEQLLKTGVYVNE